MDAASLWLLTVVVADELVIRHTVWHPQLAAAAIWLIVAARGKLEEILWSVFDASLVALWQTVCIDKKSNSTGVIKKRESKSLTKCS